MGLAAIVAGEFVSLAAARMLMLTIPYWPRMFNCLSLCRLNLRPKSRRAADCVPANPLPAVQHGRKLHAVFELQLYHLISVFAHVVSLHHLRVGFP